MIMVMLFLVPMAPLDPVCYNLIEILGEKGSLLCQFLAHDHDNGHDHYHDNDFFLYPKCHSFLNSLGDISHF